MVDDAHRITTLAELRAVIPEPSEVAAAKTRPTLDEHSRRFIAMAPFVAIGTQSADGRGDVSPKGDPAGFVAVLDDTTIVIPDRPGNNRTDTFANVIANPAVGLLFVVPGLTETLRVNGTAALTTDPELLATLAVNGREPKLAMVVTVTEAFLHCGKALIRSKLWDPDRHVDRSAMPSIGRVIADQLALDDDFVETADAALADDYRDGLY
jgi:PPOX class probable FMN-dependent enzyme